MKKSKPRAIRVVKKGIEPPVPPDEPPTSDRSIMAAVDNWIKERNDSRDDECTFSSISITKWRNQNYVRELI